MTSRMRSGRTRLLRARSAIPSDHGGGGRAEYAGRVEGVVDGHVQGWAYAPSMPAERLLVQVLLDGRVVATGQAAGFRPSLVEQGIGDGGHAFSIPLPVAHADAPAHTVQVLAGKDEAPLAASRSFAATTSAPGHIWGATLFVPARTLDAGATRRRWLEHFGPFIALAVGLLVMSALLLYLTRRLGFWQDEWWYVTTRTSWSPGTFLEAFNQHPLILPIGIFKVLLSTVGMQHTWPYRAVLILLHGTCVVLVWSLARRRLGEWMALVPAALLLVLGAGWEDLTAAVQVEYLGATAAGLGAVLLLDRCDRKGDRWACCLLVASWMFSGVGVPIILGVALQLAWSRRSWSRWWVVGVPLALYALWYLGYGSNAASFENILLVPRYAVAGASATFGGLVGLDTGVGTVLLVATTVLVARQLATPEGLTPRTAMGFGAFVLFWAVTALNRAQYHQPDASRYIYPAAVLLLVAAGGQLGCYKVPRRVVVLIVFGVLAAWLSGYQQFIAAAYDRDVVDGQVKAELGAVDVAGATAVGSVFPDPHHAPVLTISEYRAAERAYHSTAGYDVPTLRHLGEDLRQLTDRELIRDEAIHWVHATTAVSTGSAFAVDASTGTRPARDGDCLLVRARGSSGSVDFTVPHGQGIILHMGPGAVVDARLRRFAHTFPAAADRLLGATNPQQLVLPDDRSSLPWHARLVVAGSGEACPKPLG